MKIGKIEINKKLFITLIVVVSLAIICFILKSVYVNRYQKYKIDKDKDYIYTYKNFESLESNIPYINLNTNEAKKINNDLKKMALAYEDGFLTHISTSYHYNVSSNYVSLVLITRTITDKKLDFKFYTYVFDLKNKAKLLSDDEILSLYNKDEDDIENKLDKEMKKKYNYEIEQTILPASCDYNCFLSLRNIDNYTDDAQYYIENGELVVYRSYDVYSDYNEEDYYTRDDFKFYIN